MVDDEKEATVAKEGGGGSPSPPQQGDGRTPQRGFYRRYRPRTFAQVVGQEHVVKVLRNALASGRVFHAYFFSGPKGTGKTTIARILACALNCEKKLGDDACGECVSCQRIIDGTGENIDVLELDAASQRGINEAKRLRELSYFCPYSDWKVFVLDEVHALTTEACNVLLKLLEEPPPNVVYILATTNPEKVLPTVLSRCQRFNFFPLTVEEIKRVLMTVVEGEGIEATPEAISMIASHARGSARDALTLLEQLTILYPSIGEEEVLEFLGLPGKEIIGAFFRALCERNFPLLFSMLDQLSLQGVSYRGFFEALKEGIRSLMVRWVAESLDERALSQYRDVLEREKDELWSLVPPSLSVPDIVRWGERFAEGRPEGEQESKEWLENFCFRECYFATTGKEMIDMENIRRGAALPKRLGGRRGEVQPPAASGDAMVDGGGPSPRLVIGSASPFQGDVEGRTEAEEEAKEESLTRSGPAISGSPEAERLLRKISNMMSSLYSKGRLSLSPEEREKLKMGLEKYFLLSLGGDGRGLRCPSPPSLCPSGLVPRIFPREERETCPFCGSRLVELT